MTTKTVNAATEQLQLEIPAPKARAKKTATPKPEVTAKQDTMQAEKAPVKAKAPTKKTVTKPASSVAKKGATKFVPGAQFFALDETSRPSAGRRLAAHTDAALRFMGMMDAARPAVPKRLVLSMMGQRAVTYHTGRGNFESAADGGMRLSIVGYNFFSQRVPEGKVDTALSEAFQTLFSSGAVEGTGVRESNVYSLALSA